MLIQQQEFWRRYNMLLHWFFKHNAVSKDDSYAWLKRKLNATTRAMADAFYKEDYALFCHLKDQVNELNEAIHKKERKKDKHENSIH